MKQRNPFHQRYHDDWLSGCRNLTLEERGVYNTLVDLMYSGSNTIIDDDRRLAAEMGISARKYRSVRDSLLRKGKIYYYSEGRLSNRRFEEEITKREARSAAAQEAGRKGGMAKAKNTQIRSRVNRFGLNSTVENIPNSGKSTTKSMGHSSSSEAIYNNTEDVSELSGEAIKPSAELIKLMK